MSDKNSIVVVYSSHPAAEAAVKELKQAGFDIARAVLILRWTP